MVHGGVEVEVDRKIERVTVCDLPFRVYRAGLISNILTTILTLPYISQYFE